MAKYHCVVTPDDTLIAYSTDAEAGRIAARRNAENKIWPLMGYELKCRLAKGEV